MDRWVGIHHVVHVILILSSVFALTQDTTSQSRQAQPFRAWLSPIMSAGVKSILVDSIRLCKHAAKLDEGLAPGTLDLLAMLTTFVKGHTIAPQKDPQPGYYSKQRHCSRRSSHTRLLLRQ